MNFLVCIAIATNLVGAIIAMRSIFVAFATAERIGVRETGWFLVSLFWAIISIAIVLVLACNLLSEL